MAVQPETLKFGPQWIRELSDGAFGFRRHLSQSPTNDRMTTRSENPISNSQKYSNMSDICVVTSTNRHKDLVTDQYHSVWGGDYSKSFPSKHETSITGQLHSEVYQEEYPQCLMTARTEFQTKCPGQKVPSHNVSDVSTAWFHKNPLLRDAKWQTHTGILDTISVANHQIAKSEQASLLNRTLQCRSSPINLPDIATYSSGSSFPHPRSNMEGTSVKGSMSLLKYDPVSNVNLRTSAYIGGMSGGSAKRAVSAYYGIEDQDKLTVRPVTCQSALNILDEERGLHQPDGADQPDEHMWLYEDPQGRTQGSFSDAQMHEWLLAGIYFTPSLRIRRKCDDTVSSLACYTQLFGRVPFIPGPRVPPIRGGITPNMLTSVTHNDKISKDNANITDCGVVDRLATTVPLHHNNSSVVNSNLFTSPSPNELNQQKLQSSVFTDPQHSVLHCADKLDVHSSTTKSSVSSSTAYPCAVDSDKLLTSKPLNELYAPRSQPHSQIPSTISTMIHNMAGLDVAAETEAEFGSPPDSSQSASRLASSSTLFADLSSFLATNATNAQPLGPRPFQTSSSSTTAASSTTATMNSDSSALVSPAFVSALAQYLNVQSPTTNQISSPMQQLAETAQLAAQLAALVGAHSPDQTPMQPTQALALAQFLITRGVGLGRKENDINTSAGLDSSSNTNSISLRKDDDFHGDVNSNVNSVLGNSMNNSAIDSQSQWPSLTVSASSHLSLRINNDGRFSSIPKHIDESSTTTPYGHNASNSTVNLCDSNSTHLGNLHRGIQLTKSPSGNAKTHAPYPTNLRSMNNKSGHHDSTTTTTNNQSVDYTAPKGWTYSNRVTTSYNSDEHNAEQQKQNYYGNKTKLSATTSIVGGSGAVNQGHVQSRPDLHSSSTGSNTQLHLNQKGSNSSSKLSTAGKSPAKPNNNEASSTVSHNKVNKSNSSEVQNNYTTPPTGNKVNVNSNSDETVEEELKKLTQWCQYRLSTIPMREKVDIPTVVELLATLDAPYEVERMVQTFLGETARTTQFVKEFLDHRRPFWQLHRERRELASAAQLPDRSSSQNSNVSRSTDKKKRTAGDVAATTTTTTATITTQRHNTVACNGLTSSHSSGTDQLQDNQWHHIKSKGNHNRKSKKDKSS